MIAIKAQLKLVENSDCMRALNSDSVSRLAASMNEVGLLQPIIVREVKLYRGGAYCDGHRIIAGHHRAEAARSLGWEEIDALVADADMQEAHAELIEIDENLCRAELSPAQRAAAIKRRKEIWESLHPEGGSICATLGGNQVVGFAADTAKVSGEPKASINRHLSRAEALGDDLQAVAGTSLDKGVELDALKAMPAEERAPLIERAKAGENVTARKPMTRLSLSIEYEDMADGAVAFTAQLIQKDRRLAMAIMQELEHQLSINQEAA